MDFFNIKTGDHLKTENITGELKKTLNETFLYERYKKWCVYPIDRNDSDITKTFYRFECISNDGMYLLTISTDYRCCRIYQTSTLRSESQKKNKSNFEFGIFMTEEIWFVDFSYDSKYILIFCRYPSSYDIDSQLFVYSIELRKFILILPTSSYDYAVSFEDYLIICDNSITVTKYGDKPINHIRLSQVFIVNLNKNPKLNLSNVCSGLFNIHFQFQ